MKKIFFFGMIALLCSCQTNEPEYAMRPDRSISHRDYVEPTYEELCAMWDADTTLANAKPDTIVLPKDGHYIPFTTYPWGNTVYDLRSNHHTYDPLDYLGIWVQQWHCKEVAHNGYYSSSCPEDSLQVSVDYHIDRHLYYELYPVYSTAAKCIIYDFKKNKTQKPNIPPQYVFSWRLLFEYIDPDGKKHCYYTEGHPEE